MKRYIYKCEKGHELEFFLRDGEQNKMFQCPIVSCTKAEVFRHTSGDTLQEKSKLNLVESESGG